MADPWSDEVTGLPPLDEPTEEDSIWAMMFTSCQADVISPVDRSPQGAMVVSIRGLINTADSKGPEWGQVHAVFPHGSLTALKDRIEEYLSDFPEATQ